MERRHHNRIPVELNAVLIGEKTVPKGCKVSNVSLQGLLLKCVSDGRVLTFKRGNIVNVHLLFQQSGGCKYLTKTADVKHADENSIGVEFHQPDSDLVEFIKPCRIDSGDAPDTISIGITASATEGPDMHNATNADFIDKTPGITTVTDTREPGMAKGKGRIMFFSGLAFLVMAAGLAIGAWLYTSHINTRISALETVTEKHSSELTEMQEWALPASMLEGKFAYLNAQMKALTESFEKLDNRLTADSAQLPVKIVAQADTGAAGTGNGAATTGPADTETAETPAASVEKAAIDSARKTTPKATPAILAATPAPATTATPATTASGPWVINLISSQDKAAVDRFAARARTKGIPAELVKAEVKGRDFWRAQLTGFASRDAARAYAGPAKEKLRLKDVWIFRK
jgi:cell division septation protein DedD